MAYAKSANTKIYYETHGDGPAILFAHGAGGNAAIWFEQIAHFSKTHQCVAFDHRSFARSPCDPASITIPQFRDDAIAVLDGAGVDKADLVCQSMGGFTGLRMALDAPDRVRSLTMSCTPGGIPMPRPTEAARGLLSSDGSSGILQTMAEKSLADAARMLLYAQISAFNTKFSFANLGALGAKESIVTYQMLANVKCPVLFISGEEDPLFPTDQLEEFIPHFPNARLVRVKDAGHSPYFERPNFFNATLEEFWAPA
jgi:3-oxoadipate enol-lactonase